MVRLYSIFSYQRIIKQKIATVNRTISRNVTQSSSNRFCTKWNAFGINSELKTTTGQDDKNIIKSMLPDIPNYRRLCIHELIWENAANWWNKTALVCAKTGRSYTYEKLRRLSGKFAASLIKNNILPGDTIAVVLPNLPEYAIILMGASEIGVKVTLINPINTKDKIRYNLKDTEAIAVITIPTIYPMVAESIRDNSALCLPVIIVEDGTGSPASGTINFKDFIADSVEEFEISGKRIERDIEADTFLLPHSSGTSGLPKCIELTQRNIVANTLQALSDGVCSSSEAVGSWQEIIPLFLPLFHSLGFQTLFSSLRQGMKIICMPQFSSVNLIEVLEKNEVTVMNSVPPVIQLMISNSRFHSRHTRNISSILNGAASLGDEMINKFLSRFGNHIALNNSYGLTETSSSISMAVKSPINSCGVIVPNTAIRVVGYESRNKGENLGCNKCGEIYVQGPQVMKGYLNNPEATQSSMDGDWFKTGDLGYIDEHGFLYIQGRLKDFIKVQNFQVAPAELEDVIQKHEKIADVAVIGTPHARFGEVPKAFIVPKLNMQINEQDIKNFVAQRVSSHKQLGHVVTIDKIPKTPGGKILYTELQKIDLYSVIFT